MEGHDWPLHPALPEPKCPRRPGTGSPHTEQPAQPDEQFTATDFGTFFHAEITIRTTASRWGYSGARVKIDPAAFPVGNVEGDSNDSIAKEFSWALRANARISLSDGRY